MTVHDFYLLMAYEQERNPKSLINQKWLDEEAIAVGRAFVE